MPDIDLPTVIFALVALFVAYKLRSVLGMRSDAERPTGGLLAPLRRAPGPAPAAAPVEAVLSGPSPPAPAADRWKSVADPGAWSGLDAIVAADRSFTPEGFLSGARAAYEMIVHAFAAGDSATLRGLMAPEAFANFDNAIRARAAAGQVMSTTVVSIDGATISGRTRRFRTRKCASASPASSPPSPATPQGPWSTGRRPKSPTTSISGRSRATCARAIRTGG